MLSFQSPRVILLFAQISPRGPEWALDTDNSGFMLWNIV